MKKFKKVVSIALTLAMMLTMFPSAFAASHTEAENVPVETNILSTDMSKTTSNFPANGTSSYDTVNALWKSVTSNALSWASSSTALCKIITSVGEGENQVTGTFIEFSKSGTSAPEPSFQTTDFELVNSGKIKTQFKVFPTGNLTRLRVQFNGVKSGGSTGLKTYDMKELVDSKWNTLTLTFDLDDNILYYTREADGVETYSDNSVTVHERDEIAQVKNIKTYFLTDSANDKQSYVIESIKFDIIPNFVNDVILSIQQPDNAEEGFNVRDELKFNALIKGDFTQARVISGSEVVHTFSQGASNNYEITLEKNDPKFIGENEIAVVVDFVDGTTKKATYKYKTYSNSVAEKNLFTTDMTKVPSDFPAAGTTANAHAEKLWHSLTGMSCSYDEPRGSRLYMINSFNDGTTEYTGNFFKVAKEGGVSAELNLQTDVFETMSTGIVRVTYDVFLTGNLTRTRFRFSGLKTDGTSGKKDYDMNNFVNNKWNKLTLDFNLDDNKVYYTREADGETTYTSNVYVSPSSEIDTINQFRLMFLTDGNVSDQAYIIKNISVSHIADTVNTLLPVSYTMPDKTTTVISSSAKPHSGAEKITLVANGAVVLSGTSALYNADGKAVEGTTFTANGNSVDVILPLNGVPAGKYTVALGKDTTVAGSTTGGKLSTSIEFVNSSEFMLLAPANGEKLVGEKAVVKVVAPDATKVKFYLDGKLIETKNKNASGIYGFETEAEYGLREAVVVAKNSDKADDVVITKFNLCANEADVSINSADMALNNGNKIDVVLSGSVTATDDDVELYVDGIKKSHAGVSVNDNVLSVALTDDLKDNKEIKVVLKNTIEGISKDTTVVAYVAGKNGFYADLADFELGTAKFNASLYLVGTSSVNASKVYVAAYEGNELAAVDVIDITPAEGLNFKNVSFDITESTTKVKVMVWDASSQTPLMLTAECNQ